MQQLSSNMDLEQLTTQCRHQIIFETIAGSRAYGTHTPQSDTDIRGIYVVPTREYLDLTPPENQVSDERNDTVYYTLKRFLELAANANPNIIELLYTPEDCVQLKSPVMDRLIEQRELFITKHCYESHIAYAQAQIKRARGRNKWVNNPQPEEQPEKEQFCWFIPRDHVGMPYRPIPVTQAEIDLARCHCAALEHTTNTYRLYDYGSDAKGVFRSGNLVCESIPFDDEPTKCIGLLIYNRESWDRAMKDHRNYWQWRRERNDRRWQSQERGEMDYDAKNMMHTFRLLLSGMNILQEGKPIVRFSGEHLDFLKQILAGELEYGELISRVERTLADFETLRTQSCIPDDIDLGKIKNLLIELTKMWEKGHAS